MEGFWPQDGWTSWQWRDWWIENHPEYAEPMEAKGKGKGKGKKGKGK